MEEPPLPQLAAATMEELEPEARKEAAASAVTVVVEVVRLVLAPTGLVAPLGVTAAAESVESVVVAPEYFPVVVVVEDGGGGGSHQSTLFFRLHTPPSSSRLITGWGGGDRLSSGILVEEDCCWEVMMATPVAIAVLSVLADSAVDGELESGRDQPPPPDKEAADDPEFSKFLSRLIKKAETTHDLPLSSHQLPHDQHW
jgi:hypothetical protein